MWIQIRAYKTKLVMKDSDMGIYLNVEFYIGCIWNHTLPHLLLPCVEIVFWLETLRSLSWGSPFLLLKSEVCPVIAGGSVQRAPPPREMNTCINRIRNDQ
jgi:hypothetical protein